MKCPGQDIRQWKPQDIFDVPCPACGAPVEFFKDDGSRKCLACGHLLRNPKIAEECAEWCPAAQQCLGKN